MKKNILVTGIGQSNYILQLYSNIIPKLSQFSFSILNIKDLGNHQVKESAERIFDNNYKSKPNLKNLSTILRAIFPVLFNGYFWKDQLICLIDNGSKFLSSSFILTLRHINAYYYAKFIDENTNTDVIHLHFPKHIFSLFTKYLKKDYELIITYWGSDIYRIDKWMDHEIQRSILKNANLITASTPEMQFSITSRYGFNLYSKIKIARFIHDDIYYNIADKLLNHPNWIQEYKKSLGIDDGKIVILFGHNAHWENNHKNFLECLSNLPGSIANKYHIIFPLTYGDKTGTYTKELIAKSKNIEASFSFLTEFLNWEELAKLKIISNVYIHCPTTDGLSAFLTEFLYTNNLAIVGDWLPYKTFTDFKIGYLTFTDFQDLEKILINLSEKIIIFNELKSKNRDVIDNNFSLDKIANEWVQAFKEIS